MEERVQFRSDGLVLNLVRDWLAQHFPAR